VRPLDTESPDSRISSLSRDEDANGQVEFNQEEYLDQLVKLRPIELDRELKPAAKRLGVRIGAEPVNANETLDCLI
jgi:hypothetical protein